MLEFDVDSVPTVYVKGYVGHDDFTALLDVLRVVSVKDVHVENDGTVIADEPVVVSDPVERREGGR